MTLTLLLFLSKFFQGYSFIAPSILFDKNAVMGDFVESQVGADRPGSASVQRSAMLEVQIWTYEAKFCFSGAKLRGKQWFFFAWYQIGFMYKQRICNAEKWYMAS